jgi:hypothetical protein
MTVRVARIAPGRIFHVLADRQDLVERLVRISNGRATSDSIVTSFFAPGVSLWAIIEDDALVGFAVTTLITYAGGTVLRVLDVVTDRGVFARHAAELFARLEEFAREVGARWVDFDGRPGWVDWAKQAGFKARRVIFVKEVTP